MIAEAEALGDATAQGAKAARDAFAATPPSASRAFDRLEPRVEPEGLRPPMRPPSRAGSASSRAAPTARQRTARDGAATSRRGRRVRRRPTPPRDRTARHRTQRAGPPRTRRARCAQPSADDIDELPKRSRVGLVAAILDAC